MSFKQNDAFTSLHPTPLLQGRTKQQQFEAVTYLDNKKGDDIMWLKIKGHGWADINFRTHQIINFPSQRQPGSTPRARLSGKVDTFPPHTEQTDRPEQQLRHETLCVYLVYLLVTPFVHLISRMY